MPRKLADFIDLDLATLRVQLRTMSERDLAELEAALAPKAGERVILACELGQALAEERARRDLPG